MNHNHQNPVNALQTVAKYPEFASPEPLHHLTKSTHVRPALHDTVVSASDILLPGQPSNGRSVERNATESRRQALSTETKLTPTVAPVYFKPLQEITDPGRILLVIDENTRMPAATQGYSGDTQPEDNSRGNPGDSQEM